MTNENVENMLLIAEQVQRDFTAVLAKESPRYITLKGGLRPLSETVGKDVLRFLQFYAHENLMVAFNTVVHFILDFQKATDEQRASYEMYVRWLSDVVAESDFLSNYRQAQWESAEVARYLELCRLGAIEQLLDERKDFWVYCAYMEDLHAKYENTQGGK